MGANGMVNYDNQTTRDGSTNMVGYSNMIDRNNNYSIRAGVGNSGRPAASGYFIHDGDLAQVTANASYQGGSTARWG
ncbi:hypothetical protein GGER_16140 [Serratia rubidaea]